MTDIRCGHRIPPSCGPTGKSFCIDCQWTKIFWLPRNTWTCSVCQQAILLKSGMADAPGVCLFCFYSVAFLTSDHSKCKKTTKKCTFLTYSTKESNAGVPVPIAGSTRSCDRSCRTSYLPKVHKDFCLFKVEGTVFERGTPQISLQHPHAAWC